MSAPRLAPPEGYATWMDYHLEGPNSVHDGWRFARAELAALRAELHRLWAVEEAAVRYRDIVKRPTSYVSLLATMESADAAESALFALLRVEVKP